MKKVFVFCICVLHLYFVFVFCICVDKKALGSTLKEYAHYILYFSSEQRFKGKMNYLSSFGITLANHVTSEMVSTETKRMALI